MSARAAHVLKTAAFLLATFVVAVVTGFLTSGAVDDVTGPALGLVAAAAVMGIGVICVVYRRKADEQLAEIIRTYSHTNG